MTQHKYSGTGRLVSHYPDLDEIHMEMTNYYSTTPPWDKPLTLYRVHILCCIKDSDGICTDVFAYNLNDSPQLDGTQLHPPGKLNSTDDWVSFPDRHWKDATFYKGADFSNSAANATLSTWRYSPSEDLIYTYCCNKKQSILAVPHLQRGKTEAPKSINTKASQTNVSLFCVWHLL